MQKQPTNGKGKDPQLTGGKDKNTIVMYTDTKGEWIEADNNVNATDYQ